MNRLQSRALRTLTIVLVGITIAAALPYAAEAANPPTNAKFSPYATAANVRALALSKNPATATLVAGLSVLTDSGGVLTLPGTTQPSDFMAFNATSGRLFNGTSSPEGKSAVGVSRNGKVAVSAGLERSAGPGENEDTKAATSVLSFYDVAGPAPPPPQGSDPGTQDPRWRLTLPGPTAEVAVDLKGDRIAVASNPVPRAPLPAPACTPVLDCAGTPETGRVVLVSDDKSVLFEYRATGRIGSVDISQDGAWVVAGGRAIDQGRANGLVLLFRSPNGDPVKTFPIGPVNASEVKDVRITPDGKVFAALTQRGEVLVWKNDAESTKDAVVSAVPAAGNATGGTLAISEDGRFVVAGFGSTLRVFEYANGQLVQRWIAATDGAVTSVDTNATAGLIVAGLAGAKGGVVAYGPRSNASFWKIAAPLGATNVTVDSRGDLVAFASGVTVQALSTKRNLALLYQTANGEGSPNHFPYDARPFTPVQVPIVVRNDGSITDRVQLTLPNSRSDGTFTANRTRFDVVPGEEARVGITFTPGRLVPGRYSYNMSAKSLDTGGVRNLTLSFDVGGVSDVLLSLEGAPERQIGPGGSDSIVLRLRNEGNSATNVSVNATQSLVRENAWNVRLVGETRFPLGSGVATTVRVIVDVPQLTTNGTENHVFVIVSTPKGVSTQEVVYKVNPFVAVNVTLQGRAKFVYAGQSVLFNVTVKNTGSIPAEFQASASSRVVGGKNWIVDVDVQPFSLQPGENRTVPVRVVAPKDSEVGERAAVTFEARSLPLIPGQKVAVENLTLIANLAERPPEPPPPLGQRGFIPAPTAPFAALALALAAVLLINRPKKVK